MHFLEITLLTTIADYVSRRTKYFNNCYNTVWYNGEPIIISREKLILNLFSWSIKMPMLYIYIKKQKNQLLFVGVVAIKIIDKNFSKVLCSQNLRKMCCDYTVWVQEKICKMRNPGLRFLLLSLFFVFSKYLPLIERLSFSFVINS